MTLNRISLPRAFASGSSSTIIVSARRTSRTIVAAPITPAMAIGIWRESAAHNAMVLNHGRWADNTWRAMGAAIGRHYAVVWFGESPDPAGH